MVENTKLNTKEIDETIRNINKVFDVLNQFAYDDNFDMLFVPSINDYIKSMKMKCNNEDELKQMKEYEKDNDDWLQGLSKKEKKIKNKQRKMKMIKNIKV
jgi:hypothetical protein